MLELSWKTRVLREKDLGGRVFDAARASMSESEDILRRESRMP